MLHTEAVLSHGGRFVAGVDGVDAARKDQGRRRNHGAGIPVLSGCAEVRVAEIERRIERWAGSDTVDVVALHALEEGSEAAAENGLAVAEEIVGEADARLEGVVIVDDHAPWETADAGKSHTVGV